MACVKVRIPFVEKLSGIARVKLMTDEEILDKYIDLSSSDLNIEEKSTLMNLIKLHKEAFSLRDEIGKCPNIKIDIDIVDDSPVFVRPFPIHEEDKPTIDKYMAKLVSWNFVQKQHNSHFPCNVSS